MSMGNENNGLADFGRLLELVASQNSRISPGLSTLPVGISGATLGNVFNPETLLATGMFSPAAFQQAVDSTYNQLLADYQSRVARTMEVPYDASFESLELTDPIYAEGTEIGELMRDAVNNIASGNVTADEALQKINVGLASGVVPAEVASSIGKIGADLEDFAEKKLPRYRDALAKYEYDSAQAMANLGVAEPTRQDARLKFYSSIGMPQLALLPDPTEQYDLPVEEFTNKATMEKLRGQSTKAMNVLGQVADTVSSPMARNWQGRANMDIARSTAEKAKQDYLNRNTKDTRDLLGKALDFAGGSPIVGGLFGGDQRQKSLDAANVKAQEIFDRTYRNKLNELQSNVPTGGAYGKEAERAARTERFVQKAIGRELELAKPKQQKAQAQLAQLGLTPWQQAMNQLMMNAQSMSTKLKK